MRHIYNMKASHGLQLSIFHCETFSPTQNGWGGASRVQIWSQPHTKLSNDMFTATRQDKEFPHKQPNRERWNKTVHKVNQMERHERDEILTKKSTFPPCSSTLKRTSQNSLRWKYCPRGSSKIGLPYRTLRTLIPLWKWSFISVVTLNHWIILCKVSRASLKYRRRSQRILAF